jgi:hypothetical protein
MRVRKGCALGLSLLLLCLVAAGAFAVVSVLPVFRAPSIAIEDLVIDASLFPHGWYSPFDPEPIPEREYGERESLYIGFTHEGLQPYTLGASHTVYRYRNEIDAAILYTLDFSRKRFANHYMRTPWAAPEAWSYESAVADRFRFACGELDSEPPEWVCQSVAQYDEYISVFSGKLSGEYMSLEQMESILIGIDDRMALYLAKDTH